MLQSSGDGLAVLDLLGYKKKTKTQGKESLVIMSSNKLK